jgi:hypothetical protein
MVDLTKDLSYRNPISSKQIDFVFTLLINLATTFPVDADVDRKYPALIRDT